MARDRTNTSESISSAFGVRERTNTADSHDSWGLADLHATSLSHTPLQVAHHMSPLKPTSPAKKRSWIHKAIEWIQSHKIHSRNVITGIDRVVFGTTAAADAVKILGVQPPRYLFYMVSGFVCDIIQLLIDTMLYLSLHIQNPSVCWASSFALSIAFRHTFHRYLVFGDYVGGYYRSLLRMYAAYSIIIALSTLFNYGLTNTVQIGHYFAWVATMLWTGIANYFILKRIWSFGGNIGAVTTATGRDTKQ